MNDLALAVASLLAQNEAPGDSGPEFGKAGPFGLLIVVLLFIGTLLLVWSMNRHLRKLPKSFDRDNSEPGLGTDAGATDDGPVDAHPDSTTDSPDDGSPGREPDR